MNHALNLRSTCGKFGFDKCLLIIMHPKQRVAYDFVEIVYECALSAFYYFHDHSLDLSWIETLL